MPKFARWRCFAINGKRKKKKKGKKKDRLGSFEHLPGAERSLALFLRRTKARQRNRASSICCHIEERKEGTISREKEKIWADARLQAKVIREKLISSSPRKRREKTPTTAGRTLFPSRKEGNSTRLHGRGLLAKIQSLLTEKESEKSTSWCSEGGGETSIHAKKKVEVGRAGPQRVEPGKFLRKHNIVPLPKKKKGPNQGGKRRDERKEKVLDGENSLPRSDRKRKKKKKRKGASEIAEKSPSSSKSERHHLSTIGEGR